MPIKQYQVADALLLIQPGAQFGVVDNDTDRIEYIVWTPPEPTEAEIDAAGVIVTQHGQDIAAERAAARAELDTGPPAQSLPGLAARVQAIEVLLGLKTYR